MQNQDSDMESETIRAIVFQDNGMWVAQCLEYDIGAQAHDLDTLHDRLKVTLRAEFLESMSRHKKPFAGIGRAPERFFRMWERRSRTTTVTSEPWTIGNNQKLDLGLVA
jgi:hypothetical protein